MDLEAIKAREQTATKGPWFAFYGGEPRLIGAPRGNGRYCLAEFNGPMDGDRCPDAIFAAAAREDIPALIAEVERLQGIIAQHNLCHDLHGKVNAEDFAKGCEAEQRRIYGCAPHADEVERLQGIINNALKIQTQIRE